MDRAKLQQRTKLCEFGRTGLGCGYALLQSAPMVFKRKDDFASAFNGLIQEAKWNVQDFNDLHPMFVDCSNIGKAYHAE